MDTPPRIEPTVAEAMLLLKNYVYITKDFKIPIKTAQGNVSEQLYSLFLLRSFIVFLKPLTFS